ncbi:c-type cytochrome [Rhizobium mesosinicum]|uniref:C-type cytochrome n=2 Tax=Rhizobium mesosinicum TaxID=335017 RepID=A0ABS7GM25_9HYPH|nr:c-type cytochrome [Rhizobium mesosinicum]
MQYAYGLACALFVSFAVHTAPAAAEGDAEKGQNVFKRCAACHANNDQNRVGPGLGGVVGRKAGTAPDYKYSPALASSNLTWDEQTLDAFLENPKKLVPGTRMTISVPKPEDRENVISYLKSLGGAQPAAAPVPAPAQ